MLGIYFSMNRSIEALEQQKNIEQQRDSTQIISGGGCGEEGGEDYTYLRGAKGISINIDDQDDFTEDDYTQEEQEEGEKQS